MESIMVMVCFVIVLRLVFVVAVACVAGISIAAAWLAVIPDVSGITDACLVSLQR